MPDTIKRLDPDETAEQTVSGGGDEAPVEATEETAAPVEEAAAETL